MPNALIVRALALMLLLLLLQRRSAFAEADLSELSEVHVGPPQLRVDGVNSIVLRRCSFHIASHERLGHKRLRLRLRRLVCLVAACELSRVFVD